MSITRRQLLSRLAAAGAAAALIPALAACAEVEADDLPSYAYDGTPGPEGLFGHGVASGDPLADSVILWTRLSPDAAGPVPVFFELARDPEFRRRVAAAELDPTDADRDYTVKLDVDGLDPATTYYYRFWSLGRSSVIGRTRTAPAGPAEHLRFAMCSCSSYARGYFHAYREIGERADLDAVLHLGDYIYEGGGGRVRPHDPPREIVSLEDYRQRYAQYRSDPDLIEAHRQHPFIVTWDDHEIANDSWTGGAENHQPSIEGEWEVRRAAGTQAYFEWMPLREGPAGSVYRQLAYGDLVELIVLDTRIEGREAQVDFNDDPNPLDEVVRPGRQLLGAEQEAWCLERLERSEARWKLLAQQVMMAQLILVVGRDGAPDRPLNPDQWDGYPDARDRLLAHIRDRGIEDVVVLTGDIHSSWANEITPVRDGPDYDPETGAGAVAVEFITPGITSSGLELPGDPLPSLRSINPHIKFVEPSMRGYVVLDVSAARIQADWFHLNDDQISSPASTSAVHGASWTVESGRAHLVEVSSPAPTRADAPALAPA